MPTCDLFTVANLNSVRFYRARLCVSALFAVARCPSVRLSVTLENCIQTSQDIVKVTTFSTWNIPETTRDRVIVTIERQLEVVCALSNGDISSDLDGPLTRFSRSQHFKSNISKRQSCYRTLIGNHRWRIDLCQFQ